MPSIKNIRFQKLDDYENHVFICNETKESASHAKLKKYYSKLQKSNDGCFLPLYVNDEHKYGTVRLKKNFAIKQLKLNSNDVCNIKFTIRRKKVESKTYISCFCDEIQIVKRAPPVILGEEIAFDSDDSEEETDPTVPHGDVPTGN